MTRKILTVISILIITMLTACGAAAQPTLSVTDIQNTAFPIVMTQYAQTKAAIPTATPIPPTPTIEAATLAPLPTFAAQTTLGVPVVDPNATATPDCYTPAPATAKLLGTKVQIKLVNKAGGPISPLSLGMYKPDDQGECFTFTFSLRDKEEQLVTILSGCYWGSGYQNGPKPSTPRVDYICITDTGAIRGLTISKDTMGFD